ncbi:MAG: Jag N-terminal domain-containing protein [Candidatus Cloacimonetes bacterium]|jgi:spoIIIJ-associated protein|nr:Jag N-terminal domain-containing protein [Candidatus Cloacimonadota bacterium]
MKEILVTGKSTSKIISEFMKENNLELNDFKFEVIEEGSSSFLGLFGSKPTTIKFIYKESKAHLPKTRVKSIPKSSKKIIKKVSKKTINKTVNTTNSSIEDITTMIQEFAEGILKRMNIESGSVDVTQKDGTYLVTISNSKDAGFIIGKEAKMLDSFQHLLNQMINKAEKKKIQIIVDVDGYRERRKKALIDRVDNFSKKVKETGKSYTLEPLAASNRKVVHQYIERDSALRTRTIGEGSRKRVVILPANKPKSGQKKAK